jgi:multiple sugar transport system permease protein/N,N'-diacetylchitobiose transport system permease protein
MSAEGAEQPAALARCSATAPLASPGAASSYKVILPLVAPGLIATGVYGWIPAWNEFVLTNTLSISNHKQTAMIYLLVFQSSPTHGADYGGLMAAATLTALPVVVLFVIFQSRISSGLIAGAVKG